VRLRINPTRQANMETSNPRSDEAAGMTAPPALGSCLVNVIAAPGETFERLRSTPSQASRWLVPALLLLLVSWIGTAIVFSQDSVKQQIADMQEKGLQKQVEKGKLTQEQATQAREVATKVGGIIMMVIAYGWPVWLAFITPFWWGFLLWLIGGPILKGTCPYLKAVEVVGLANMIVVLQGVVKPLLILLTGNLFASTSPALLIPNLDPNLPLHSAALNLDVMTLWWLAVCGLGVAKLSGVAAGKAMAWTFGFWALITGVLIGIGWAIQRAFGG
jgi:hypothetical protein